MFKFGPSNIYYHGISESNRKVTNITTYLNANVVEIEADETAQTIKRVHAACLTGNRFSVKAKIFILATGGIENARLLLYRIVFKPMVSEINMMSWEGTLWITR